MQDQEEPEETIDTPMASSDDVGGSGEETEYERYVRERSEAKRIKGLPKKRTPLRRSGKPLKKTKLRPISKRHSVKLKEYKRARKEHYKDEDNRSCAICGTENNLSVHHKKGRNEHIADVDTFVTLCIVGNCPHGNSMLSGLNPANGTGCHGFVHANPDWAREKGYIE